MRSFNNQCEFSKEFLLIRHAESIKNIEHRYGSVEGSEPLTHNGYQQIKKMNSLLETRYEYKNVRIISAPESRCKETAESIGRHFNIGYEVSVDISSFTSSQTSGKSIIFVHQTNPILGQQIKLYRAGLISAEDVDWPAGSIKVLEKRIEKFINYCYTYHEKSIWIIAHKSSITCMVINILKRYNKYSKDYYGYINIDVGSAISIKIDGNNELTIDLLSQKEAFYE